MIYLCSKTDFQFFKYSLFYHIITFLNPYEKLSFTITQIRNIKTASVPHFLTSAVLFFFAMLATYPYSSASLNFVSYFPIADPFHSYYTPILNTLLPDPIFPHSLDFGSVLVRFRLNDAQFFDPSVEDSYYMYSLDDLNRY